WWCKYRLHAFGAGPRAARRTGASPTSWDARHGCDAPRSQSDVASRLHSAAGRRALQRHQLHAPADRFRFRPETRGGSIVGRTAHRTARMKLSEIKDVLVERGIKLTKSLGQN